MNKLKSNSRLLTLNEKLERSIKARDHCLRGGKRQSHQHGDDIGWLAGWADNAIEVEIIEAEIAKGNQ